jgi:hypothetical protein
MQKIPSKKVPRWSSSFKPKDKRAREKFQKNCARCCKSMVGTKRDLTGREFCSFECYTTPLGERWENFVQRTESCWFWIGTKNEAGYGVIRDGAKMVLAHRVALRLKLGVEDFDGFACHTCDTPACVRPEHLYIGSHEDNMIDLSVANTTQSSKTTWDQRKEMARRFLQGESADHLALEFNVSTKTVRRWAESLGLEGKMPERKAGLRFSEEE